MGNQPIRCAFRFYLLRRFAKGQGLCLRKDVGEQHRMMAADRIERFDKRDEITRDEPRPLMNKLIEGVLAVGAGLSPVNGTGVVVDSRTFERDMLAIALHGELLQVGRKALQILLIRQYSDR